MATKRPDKGHDSTMELSVSQLVVPSKKRPVPPTRNNPQNDMSLWGGVVVGTQDFTPAPVPAVRPKSKAKWIVGGLLLVAAALGAYLVVTNLGGNKPSPSGSSAVATPAAIGDAPKDTASVAAGSARASATGSNSGSGTTSSAVTSTNGSASVSTTGSAATAATTGSATGSGSAAASGSAGTLALTSEVDAISGVAPIIKPAVKKKPARKTTKKTPPKKTKRR